MARAAHTPHLWSRSEYETYGRGRHLRAWPFAWKLIDGEILEMAPQGTRHFTAIRLIEDALRAIFGDGWTSGPRVRWRSMTAPSAEPDVALVRGAPRDFRDATRTRVAGGRGGRYQPRVRSSPQETALCQDWHPGVLDCRPGAGQLEIYRRPEGDDYAEKRILGSGDQISPLAARTHGWQSRICCRDLKGSDPFFAGFDLHLPRLHRK